MPLHPHIAPADADSQLVHPTDEYIMTDTLAPYGVDDILTDGCFLERDVLSGLIQIWKRKKNLILQGPPGTGKTWLARRLGYALMGASDAKRIKILQFHANLSYEDFVRGWRPGGAEGRLVLEDGPMLRLMESARQDSGYTYVLIIEEINRGNTAQIFGELLTLMEAGKRRPEAAMGLCYPRTPDETVYMPDNLYLMGTMNTADRSLALVDHALRRRFAFHTLTPYFGERWFEWMSRQSGMDTRLLEHIRTRMMELNEAIGADVTLGNHYRIGHSYVTSRRSIGDGHAWFRQVIANELFPLLEEYWSDDQGLAEAAVARLLEGIPHPGEVRD